MFRLIYAEKGISRSPNRPTSMNITQQDLNLAVREWYDPLFRFALSLCRQHDRALDLTQNAFHKLAQNREKVRDPKKIKSWLFSVLYREHVDQYRRGVRYPSQSLEDSPELRGSAGHGGELSHDAKVLMEKLGELDEIFRAPLTLFYLEQLSYKEIAAVLDIPIGTVMSRLRRAKDQLRDRMEQVSQPAIIPFTQEVRHG